MQVTVSITWACEEAHIDWLTGLSIATTYITLLHVLFSFNNCCRCLCSLVFAGCGEISRTSCDHFTGFFSSSIFTPISFILPLCISYISIAAFLNAVIFQVKKISGFHPARLLLRYVFSVHFFQSWHMFSRLQKRKRKILAGKWADYSTGMNPKF